MLKFNFNLGFDENTVDLVATHKTKGKILKFSDNYYVLLSMYNQNYHDDYENKCVRPDGTRINKTVQRCWDLEHKFNVAGIKNEWVKTPGKKDYKRYWLSRREDG